MRGTVAGALVLLLLVALSGLPGGVAAQEVVTWGEVFNISNSRTSSIHPAIVADYYGYVHVFWSEDINGREIGPDELPDPPNTILYRRWDGKSWAEPLDILAVGGDPLADYVAATVDSQNQLHLVWTGLVNLYYSTAPATEAYSVRAWSTPQIISYESARTKFESDIAVDSQDNVHIVYATKGTTPGIFHVMAAPGSATWSAPVRISDLLCGDEIAFGDVRLAIDTADRLHAAWSTANSNGFSQAVYYVGGENAGGAWGPPIQMQDATINTGFTGFPSLLSHGRDELLLIHVDQGNKGRIERNSIDAGQTWSEPRFILTSMEGVNGFLIPLIDGGSGLHLVINMRPSADQRTGIFYAPRDGLDWAPITPVAVDEPYGPSAHYTDAVIRLGNEIHVVWTQLRSGEIWYVKGTIDGLDPIRPQAVPTAATPAVQETPPASVLPAATTEPTAGPEDAGNRPPIEVAAPTDQPATTWTPLVAAVLPVLALLAGAMLWQLRKR